jgi:hypothetical protein
MGGNNQYFLRFRDRTRDGEQNEHWYRIFAKTQTGLINRADLGGLGSRDGFDLADFQTMTIGVIYGR